MNRDLLILSCSQSKRSSQELLTGLDCYNGPAFRVLRKFLQHNPSTPLDIYIVSAQFGLISSQELIPEYDRKMTKARSQELNASVLEKLERISHQSDYQRLLICVTQNYLPVLEGYKGIIPKKITVTVATGTLGRKLSVLHQWLYGESSPSLCQNIMTNQPGTLAINGVKLNLTKVKIIEVARQALTEKKGKPNNYQTWYALVDDRRVSPKWLVSQITGLPVSSFHSQAARRVLQQLGIEVYSEKFSAMTDGEQLNLFTPEQQRLITHPPQPHILIKLQENALTVAESLRGNYFENTAKLIDFLRQQNQSNQLFKIDNVDSPKWTDFKNEVVTFIDGGVGQVEMNSPVPILIRVGSYKVKTGEHDISKREEFGYYPIIFGDLEGGSKERKDFVDIVRITSELIGAIAALERTPDLKVLMIHGPLVYMMSAYAGHSPFTEKDIDLFLSNYAGNRIFAQKLKSDFFKEAKLCYPKMTSHHQDLIDQKLFEPLTWIAFLYQRLIKEAKSKKRKVKPLIMGVIERNNLREFSGRIFSKIFDIIRKNNQANYFNDLYGRTDLNDPKVLLERLNYTDTLLLSMLLETQEFSDAWEINNKYENIGKGKISLPNESSEKDYNWSYLKPSSNNEISFPRVTGFYLKVNETTEPIRIEVFNDLGKDQIKEAAKRVFLYSQLLPGYGFPIGLDVVDKYAKVPKWMTDAYAKQIQYHLAVSLSSGQITDEQMRKMLIKSIYMTKRDWLFRPHV